MGRQSGLTGDDVYGILHKKISSGGGEGGTSDYTALTNKPTLNGVEISGDKTSEDYGIKAVVHVTGNDSDGYTADKTFDEIKALVDDGVEVVALFGPNKQEISLYASNSVSLTFKQVSSASLQILTITIKKDNTITCRSSFRTPNSNIYGMIQADPATEEDTVPVRFNSEDGKAYVSGTSLQQAVDAYLEENPVSGMTEEQEEQLNQNTTDVTDLKSAINEKVNKSGWTPGKYLGTDSDGNIVVKNVPDGSGGDTEPSSQNLIDTTQYTNSGYAGDLFTQFGGNVDVFNTEIDTSENKTFYYRVYRNNQIYDHKVGLKVGCYDSSGDWLYTMVDNSGDYMENFESYAREDGTYDEPLETVEGNKVVVKIIGILTIPSEVSKIKIGINGKFVMVNAFYPVFAVSDEPITNFGSITSGDYSLIQGEASGGDEEASSNKPLLNKVLGMIGDSLTNWGGGNDTQNGFLKIIHDRTGILTVNLGLAGATWEEADGQTQPGVTRVDTYVSGAARYDCIAFLLGTNVANQGEVTDTSDTKTTMCGAIKYCLEQLITLSPTTPIIVFLPPQRAEGNTEQKARNDIIKQICEIYGVYTFDLYTRSQVIPNTTVTGNGTLSDGLHLSKKGQENFGRIMSTAILDAMGY